MVALLFTVLSTMITGAPTAHADDWRDKQWHLDFLRIEDLHKITKGAGVTVAVVDTGVDGSHPDLQANVLEGTDLAGGDGRRDTDGHGTAMASLIAGHGHGPGRRDGVLGLAPESKILPISGDPERGLSSTVLRDATVVNLSFKRAGLALLADDALKAGKIVVAAAGNTSQGDKGVQPPANHEGVIAVAGIGEDGNFADMSVQGAEVVLAAPAVNIAGAGAGRWGRYNTVTGTSAATALVSATAALIRANYPNISANGVINRLIRTADDKGPPGRDPKYGFGVVNPLKALTAQIPDIDHNPLLTDGSKPSMSASRATAAPTEGEGFVIPMLVILGGVIALTLVGSGAYLLTRNVGKRAIVGVDAGPRSEGRHNPHQRRP